MPTILAAAGVEAPLPKFGRDLLETASPVEETNPAFFQCGRHLYGIRTHRWKLIENTLELYNLQTDPDELHNRQADDPEVAPELLEILQSWKASVSETGSPTAGVLTSEEVQHREALGYTDGGNPKTE